MVFFTNVFEQTFKLLTWRNEYSKTWLLVEQPRLSPPTWLAAAADSSSYPTLRGCAPVSHRGSYLMTMCVKLFYDRYR